MLRAVSSACVGVCVPGESRCTDKTVETGGSQGQWVAAQTCDYVCFGGACAGECLPGATRCDQDGVQTCGANGLWAGTVACSGGSVAKHTKGTCQSGTCIVTCETGYGDCGPSGDGTCESMFATDSADCGACGHACGPGSGCQDSMCVPANYAKVSNNANSIISNVVLDAAGNVYWGESGNVISKFNGTSTSTVATNQPTPRWVFHDGSKLCWTVQYGSQGDFVCLGGSGLPETKLTLENGLGIRGLHPRMHGDSVLWYGVYNVAYSLRNGSISAGASSPLASTTYPENFFSHMWNTATYAYWTTSNNHVTTIKRKAYPNGSVEEVLTGLGDGMSAMVLDGNTAFVVNNRDPVNGLAAQVLAINLTTKQATLLHSGELTSTERYFALATDGTYLFWSTIDGRLDRYRLSDGQLVQLTGPYVFPWDAYANNFTLDDQYVYWASSGGAPGYVQRVKKSHWSDF